MIKITSWALVLGALASSTAAGFVNRQPTAVFNLTSPLGRSFLSDSTALRARGDLPSGSGCNFDADCSTGWCSFDFEIGNNAYVNYASKTCKPMPYSGPCSSSSQCSTGNCDSTSSTCAYANDPARTCTYNTDCESQFCSKGICSLNGGDACRNDVPCGDNGCNSFASPQPTCTRQPVRNSCLRNAQCINNVCGTGTSTYNCGFSLQADGSILRSERCWRSDYCRFAGIGTSCDPDYYGGDCANRFNLDCDTDTNMCSLGLAGFRCYSGSECLSNVCGQSPYPQLGSSGVCIALPAGSPCILNRQCGSSVCDSGTGKCAVGEVGSRCFFNHDCSNSVCDTESSFTCVVPHVEQHIIHGIVEHIHYFLAHKHIDLDPDDFFHFHFHFHFVHDYVEACDRKLGLFDLKFDHDYVEAGDYKQSIYNIEFDYCHDVEAGEHKYEHECERIDDEVDNQFLIVDSHVWVEHDDQACYDLGQYCDIQICVDEQEQQQHHVKIQHIVDHLQVDHIGDDQQAHKHVHFFHHKQVDFDFDKNHSRLVQHEPSDDDDDQVEHDYLYPYAYQDSHHNHDEDNHEINHDDDSSALAARRSLLDEPVLPIGLLPRQAQRRRHAGVASEL